MNIDGMGDALVDQLLDRGLVKNVADMYTLSKRICCCWSAWAEKSAQNVLGEIEASKKLRLERVLFGLGMRFVGERTAEFLAAALRLDGCADGGATGRCRRKLAELQQVEEVGPRIAASIREFFEEPKNLELIERLRHGGVAVHAARKKNAAQLLRERPSC